MNLFLSQVEYHGQQDDLEQSASKSVETVESFREIEAPASKSFDRNTDLASIEAGDHLFFEDLSFFKPVKLLRVGPEKKSKINSKTTSDSENFEPPKTTKSDSVQDYLTEIDRQYFGTVTSKTVNEGWCLHKIIMKRFLHLEIK